MNYKSKFLSKFVGPILIIAAIIGFSAACSGGDSGGRSAVGPYKYPDWSWETKQDQRVMGHRGHDIQHPTADEIEFDCSICHYVY